MCSAHRLTKKKMSEVHENQPKGSGIIELTQNSRVNSFDLTGDLESR